MKFKQLLIEKHVDAVDIHSFNFSALYSEFNNKYFDNKLPSGIPITIKPLKSVGGRTLLQVMRRGRVIIPDSIKVKGIEISSYIEATKDRISGILAHEMIHVWVALVDKIDKDPGGKGGHGVYFQSKLKKVNELTPFKVPMTDDTQGLEVSDDIKSRKFFVLLRTEAKTNNYYISLFTRPLDDMEKQRIRTRYVWDKSTTMDMYESDERLLLKFDVKRKLNKSLGFNFIDKDLADIIKKNGKFIESINLQELKNEPDYRPDSQKETDKLRAEKLERDKQIFGGMSDIFKKWEAEKKNRKRY